MMPDKDIIKDLLLRLAQEAEDIAVKIQKLEHSLFPEGQVIEDLHLILNEFQGIDLIKQQASGLATYLNLVAADWGNNRDTFTPHLAASYLPLAAQRERLVGTATSEKTNVEPITLWPMSETLKPNKQH